LQAQAWVSVIHGAKGIVYTHACAFISDGVGAAPFFTEVIRILHDSINANAGFCPPDNSSSLSIIIPSSSAIFSGPRPLDRTYQSALIQSTPLKNCP